MADVIAPLTINNQIINAPIYVGQSGRGFVDRGIWITGLSYYPLEYFQNSNGNNIYVTRKFHISTTIAEDLISGNISEILNVSQFEDIRNECIDITASVSADKISTNADRIQTSIDKDIALTAVATIDDTVLALATNLITTQAIIAQYHAFT